MPFYSFKCGSCGGQQQDLRQVADREVPGVCKVCGKPTVFTPFGQAPGIKMDVGYHRAGSSDGRAWDHILGTSADAGRRHIHQEFQKKNRMVAQDKAVVFRQDKGTYREATVGDLPQIATNHVAAKSAQVKADIQSGRVKNPLVDSGK